MKSLPELLKTKILLIDGGMGTMIQKANLQTADFGSSQTVGCNEYLVISRPDVIKSIHQAYLEAGADIIETNTFGSTPLVLSEYGLQNQAEHLNYTAAQLARTVADAFSSPQKSRFVAGSMGPTTKSLSVTGGISFDELAKNYTIQAHGLIRGGVDYLLLETAMDTRNLKAGIIGIHQAFQSLHKTIPIAISVTIESSGTMLAGQDITALYTSLEHINPLYIGMNCALGPDLMRTHIRTLAQISKFPTFLMPNAGMPDETGHYSLQPIQFAEIIKEYVDAQWVNLIGGCCGTNPTHIQALSDMLAQNKTMPRNWNSHKKNALTISGIDLLSIEEIGRPYLVGERTNVIGSRNFKDLISAEKFEEGAELARKQVRNGAHVIDICLSNPDRSEKDDMALFLEVVTKKIKVPFMIDSQNPEVVKIAFQKMQGKCILNSVNLEDNGRLCNSLLPLVHAYGAAVVVGCIQNGMPSTALERLEIAKSAYHLITDTYHISPENIIFDPLVFPIATGEEKYQKAAKETILAIQLIKQTFPQTKTILGISNVSFGLPPNGREILNSLFLSSAVKAGLDFAIVNTEKLIRLDKISETERRLGENLLFDQSPSFSDAMTAFITCFREKKIEKTPTTDSIKIPLEEQLADRVIQGSKEQLIDILQTLLKTHEPLAIIETMLMTAMDEVGRKFHQNELIITEVLQSAEVMKVAIDYLEPFLNKTQSADKAIFLLATVKGDVHDIGKNLVKMILTSNGYDVVDLGINIDTQRIITAYQEHHPQLIGLSGLLVKSAEQMIATLEDLANAGISVPILVGGAALSENFVKTRLQKIYPGTVHYAKDAMSGLFIVNQEIKSS